MANPLNPNYTGDVILGSYQRTLGTIAAMTLALGILPPRGEARADAEEFLRRVDDVRNPAESYKMTIEVKSSESESTLEVFMKGQEKTVVVTKEPSRDRGRNMLMLDRDFYAYVPNLKRSVRLSLAQKLSGQVANGDITRTRWYGDYGVKVAGKKGGTVELLLDGAKDNLTYQKIRLWVETKSAHPLRAEYLSLDGKTVLKRATFEAYKKAAGRPRPTLIRIKDATGAESTIRILSMKATDLEDSFFTEHNMESLR